MDHYPNLNKMVHLNPKFVQMNPNRPKVLVNPKFVGSSNSSSGLYNYPQLPYDYQDSTRVTSNPTNTFNSVYSSYNNTSLYDYNKKPIYTNTDAVKNRGQTNSTPHKNVYKVDRRNMNSPNSSKVYSNETYSSNIYRKENNFSAKSKFLCDPRRNELINSPKPFGIKPKVVTRNKIIRDNSTSNNISNSHNCNRTLQLSNIISPKPKSSQSYKVCRISPPLSVKKHAKYSLNTRTKLIRRKSLDNPIKKYVHKSPEPSPRKKYKLITKTKLVRVLPLAKKCAKFPGNKYTTLKSSKTTIQLAKEIKTKYKINRLKNKKNVKGHDYVNIGGNCYKSTKTSLKKQNSFPSKSTNSPYKKCEKDKKSDKFIKIGDSMYKATKLSLQKHVPKTLRNVTLESNLHATLKSRRNLCKTHKVVSNSSSPSSRKLKHKQSDSFINIGGILYKSTKTSLKKQAIPKDIDNHKKTNKTKDKECTIKLRGQQFRVSKDGCSLHRTSPGKGRNSNMARIYIGGLTYSSTTSGKYVLTKYHRTRKIVNNAKQRSVAVLTQNKKINGKFSKNNKFCLFYNRFGKCNNKEKGKCPYVHDVNKIAICTRFLRGKCDVNNCLFSHKIDPSKMPVCSHYIRTACTKDNCPYRHVRVNPNAPFCTEFLQGNCSKGDMCKKHHILECEEFNSEKGCPRGKSCPLSHRKIKVIRKRKHSTSSAQTKKLKTKKPNNLKAKYPRITNHKRYFQENTEVNNESAMNIDISKDFKDKKRRVLEKVNRMVSNIKIESDHLSNLNSLKSSTLCSLKDMESTSSLGSSLGLASNNIESTEKDIIIKVCPFVGELPAYIPLEMDAKSDSL